MNWIGYVILGIIIALCVLIIVHRAKEIKKGKYCTCGCKDCPAKNKCKEKV